MKKIRFWAIGLCLILLLSSVGILTASANATLSEGVCGENVRWSLDTDTGELTISGEGAINDYSPLYFPIWLNTSIAITSVTVEEGITALGQYTFVYCFDLTEVTLPDSLEVLPAHVFDGCRSLTSIQLPASLTEVGEGAFNGCESLTEVILPEGVTAVGNNAFKGCTALTTVVLPSTLTSLGDNVLAGAAPETVLFKGDAEAWASVAAGADNEALAQVLDFHTEHSFDREVAAPRYLATEAACYESALYYKSCICGETDTETFSFGDPAGHRGGEATCLEPAECAFCGESYGELADHTPGAEATCTEDQLCTVCDEVLTEKLGHDYKDAVTPPTCVDEGFTTHVCARCADEYTDTPVDALGHTEGPAATCTEDQICTVCNEVLTEKLGHDYKDTVTPPTCLDEGFTTHVCDRCADEYTDTPVGALGHTEGPAATCTEDQLCTVCQAVLAEKLGHDYKDTVTPPTCVDEGFTTHVCARCADEYTDTPVDALGHTEGPAATCTEDQLCTVCQAVLTEKLGHSYTDKVTLPPTCVDSGVRTHTCSVCDYVYFEAMEPLGHTEGPAATCTHDQLCTVCNTVLTEKFGHDYTDTVVEPTCTEQGYTAHACSICLTVYHDAFTDAKGHTEGPAPTCTEDQLCSDCGALLAEKTGHSYTEEVVEPTCTAQGYTLHRCEVCGDTYRDSFTDAKGHTEGPAATCTEDQLCTVCEIVLTPALGHENTDTVVDPTCNLPGYTQHTCARCQTTYRDTVTPATGHTPGAAPTCTDAQTCTSCGEILAQKLGHDYRSTVVAGSCTTPGYIAHECALCHVTYRDSYTTATGHNPGVPATCTTPQLCTVCNHVITPALGHDFENTVISPTCESAGYTVHDCKVCDHVYVGEPTEALGHKAGPEATCTAPQTCTVCGALLAQKLAHIYEDTVIPPTCEEDGHTAHTCTLCGHVTLTDFTPATGHTSGDWVIIRDPDVGVSGRKHKVCETCETVLEAETFWAEQETTPTEPGDNIDHNTVAPGTEEGGFKITGGNIVVIVIVLVAAFLLWFVDMKRK